MGHDLLPSGPSFFARGLDPHENPLRERVRGLASDPRHAVPGQGRMKQEQPDVRSAARRSSLLL